MALDLRLRPGLAIVRADPDRALIVDLVRRRMGSAWIARFCFLLFRVMAKVGLLVVDPCPLMELDSRPVSVADFFAARFSPAPGSICLWSSGAGCFPIGFAIAPAGFVVVAAAVDLDFGLCRNCPAIAIAAGPCLVRRRFVADFCLSFFYV